MRIIGAHVYGYGKLENLEISNFSSQIQVFYGENEAGKSTLMSFIHSILFGFPTKLQQEQRYIPKTGIKYGGKLIVHTESHGTLVIERLPGKASGDVTVYLPNGMTEGEEFLLEILHGMDKSLYQSVYSFNLHRLQGVHNLRREDLGRFLFSSGVIGTDALMNVHDQLTKEMEALYKPNGRKPILNTQLNDLKEEHGQLVKWQEKNNSYHDLMEQSNTFSKKLHQLEHKKGLLQEKVREAERLQAIQPIVEEYEILQNQLAQLPEYEPFPEDGIRRLENLQSQLKPYEAQLFALEAKKEEWENKRQSIEVSEQYLSNESSIDWFISKKGLFEEKQFNLEKSKEALLQINEEIRSQKQQLHLDLHDDVISSYDTSISAKERVTELVSAVERLNLKKKFLDDSFLRAKDALEHSESTIKGLQRQLLTNDDRIALNDVVRSQQKMEDMIKDQKYVEDELHRIDRTIISTNKKENKSKVQLVFGSIGIVLLITATYTFLNQEWLFGSSSIFLVLLLYLAYRSVPSQVTFIEDLHADKTYLQQKLKNIQEELKSGERRNHQEATDLLLKDKQIKQQVEIEQATFLQYERAYEKVLADFEEWESRKFEIEKKAEQLKAEYKLPMWISVERLYDVYQIIEKVKERIQQKIQVSNQIQTLSDEVGDFSDKVFAVGRQLGIQRQDLTTAIEQMKLRLEEEKKKQEQFIQTQEKMEDISERISHLQLEVTHIKKECYGLWKLAKVTTEEEYRAKGHAFEKAIKIVERKVILKSQLDRYGELVKKCDPQEKYEAIMKHAAEEVAHIVEEERECQLRLSETKLRIAELEEGGTYAELLHSFEVKKSIARDNAKKWAVFTVAKDLLTKTIDQYRKVRLPLVVSKAEKYFHILTEGKYLKIYATEDSEGFIVEGQNGIRYQPNELSQATAEQLYIALRFALASTMHPNHSFPFIIDDSFVNFDLSRLDRATMLIQEIAKDNQILLFTCHPHVMERLAGIEAIHLR